MKVDSHETGARLDVGARPVRTLVEGRGRRASERRGKRCLDVVQGRAVIALGRCARLMTQAQRPFDPGAACFDESARA